MDLVRLQRQVTDLHRKAVMDQRQQRLNQVTDQRQQRLSQVTGQRQKVVMVLHQQLLRVVTVQLLSLTQGIDLVHQAQDLALDISLAHRGQDPARATNLVLQGLVRQDLVRVQDQDLRQALEEVTK